MSNHTLTNTKIGPSADTMEEVWNRIKDTMPIDAVDHNGLKPRWAAVSFWRVKPVLSRVSEAGTLLDWDTDVAAIVYDRNHPKELHDRISADFQTAVAAELDHRCCLTNEMLRQESTFSRAEDLHTHGEFYHSALAMSLNDLRSVMWAKSGAAIDSVREMEVGLLTDTAGSSQQ
jgi:hypothetical protein